MHRLHIYISALFLFMISSAFANSDSTWRLRYDLENGLPSNNVYSMAQDHNGYIWFCTDNGVVKYNGYTFRTFNTNDGLPSADIWKMFEDSYGRLWFYSYTNEIGYLKNDVYHKVNFGFPQARRINNIWEKDGYVMIETPFNYSYLLCKVDANDSVFALSFSKRTWPIHSSIIGNNFLATINRNFYAVSTDGYKMKYKKICSNASFLDRVNPATSNIYFKPGYFLYYTIGDPSIQLYNLSTYHSDTFALKQYGDDSETIYTTEIIDTTLIVYSNKAAYILSSSLKLIKKLSFQNTISPKLQVSHYYNDNIGNDWYSTNSSGSFMIPSYKTSLTPDPILNKLFDPRCLGKLQNGTTCWWSDADKTMVAIDLKGNVVLSLTNKDRLLKIMEMSKGKILLIFRHDLLEYDLNTKQYRNFLSGKSVYLSGMVTDNEKLRYTGHVFSDKARIKDSLVLHPFFDILSLSRYDSNSYLYSAGFLNIYNMHISDTLIHIHKIAEGRYPNILIDPTTGIHALYNKKNILLVNPINSDTSVIGERLLNRLHSKIILGVHSDRYANIYIHLDNKLIAYNTVSKLSTEIPVNINLTDAHVSVHKDMLIFSGSFGIAYLNIKGRLSFGDLHIAPNIKGTWYNRVYEMTIDELGKIYLVTDKGTYNYATDSLTDANSNYKGTDERITQLLLGKPYIRRINSTDTVTIEPGLQSIAFDIINYYGSGNRIFSYKIEGDTAWQETTTGEVLITNLKPGRYYLMRCYVADEIWKSKVYTFYIYKQPRWYETPIWENILLVSGITATIAFIAFIILLTRYFVNQSNKKKSKLLDLELRAIYSQINPHFIFNTLSSALFFINKKQFDEAYTHVSKFSKLLRSYLKSSQERYVTLAEEIIMLRNYIELQEIRFERKFRYSIFTDNKIPAESIKIPSLLLQPLVENAINHGLFHKQGDGLLDIRFMQGADNDELICIIEDNGVGRLRASAINKSNTVKNDSYGTKLTQKLIEIFSEYEHMDIKLEYVDKKYPDTGTIVKLTLRNLKYAT